MSVEDAERWDARYADRVVADPAPPDALVAAELEHLVDDGGTALDVACGAGAQSTWMALRGLDVAAIDVSSAAVELTTEAARRAGCAERIHARIVDLDDGLPSDLAGFDVIVCQRFRDRDLYASIVERLAPGGLAIVTVLSASGSASPGPFHAASGELASAFDRHDVDRLFHREADGEESIVVRRTCR